MQSPFPGMDPYIESCGLWGDFHDDLVLRIKYALSKVVPPRYVVRTGERSYLVLMESKGKKEHAFLPDVKIATRGRDQKAGRKKGSVATAEIVASEEPVMIRAFITEEYRENFVEIYEVEPEQRLVTTIEVLSPSNKQPETTGWEQYLRKRQGLMLSGLNLVEIDLLRGGRRFPMVDPWPNSPYTLLVSRSDLFHRCKVWPAYFQQPLPEIPVPLARPDADIPLNLQPMIEAIYQDSRYGLNIDYHKPAKPPLSAEEMKWLKGRLRQRQNQA